MSIAPKRQSVDFPLLEATWIGRREYQEGYDLQRALHDRRTADSIPDRLLLLEHPLVFTIPRRSKRENMLVNPSLLKKRGAEVVPTDRGGEITLHNPGQLVGYLICRLEPGKRDLHSYLRWIEECLAAVAAVFGVEANAREGLTGLWVGNRKMASIGIAVKRWVTLHGFALNANNDLTPFEWIHPCGLTGVEMTSLAKEKGHAIPWPTLLEATVRALGAEWGND